MSHPQHEVQVLGYLRAHSVSHTHTSLLVVATLPYETLRDVHVVDDQTKKTTNERSSVDRNRWVEREMERGLQLALTILQEPSCRRPCPAWITAMVCTQQQIVLIRKTNENSADKTKAPALAWMPDANWSVHSGGSCNSKSRQGNWVRAAQE